MAIDLVRLTIASALTAALGWFYVSQTLDYQARRDLDAPILALSAIAMLAIIFLAPERDRGRPHIRWGLAILVSASWLAGVAYAFASMTHSPYARFGPYLLLALSGAWLPAVAWSMSVLPTFSMRVATVLLLLVFQPIFPVRYRVHIVNEQGDLEVVRRRSRDAANPHAAAPLPASPVATLPDPTPVEAAPHAAAPDTDLPILTRSEEFAQWKTNSVHPEKPALGTGGLSNSMRVTFPGPPTANSWDAQVVRSGLALDANQPIAVTFRARADQPRSVVIAVGQNHAPWNNLGLYEKVSLTPELQEFSFQRSSNAAEPDSRFMIDCGDSTTPFMVADLRITPIPRIAPSSPTDEPSTNNTPTADAAPPVEPPTPPTPAPPTPAPPTSDSPTSDSPTPADSIDRWTLFVDDSATATMSLTQEGQTPVLSVQVPAGNAEEDWKIRIERSGVDIVEGQEYDVVLRVRSSAARTIHIAAADVRPPFASRGLFHAVNVGTDWKDESIRFRATQGGPSRLYLALAGAAAQIDFTRIDLRPVTPNP